MKPLQKHIVPNVLSITRRGHSKMTPPRKCQILDPPPPIKFTKFTVHYFPKIFGSNGEVFYRKQYFLL